MNNNPTNIVVFDLDGTLIDGDSTSVWINQTLIKFPIRAAIAILTLPIILPMLAFINTRHRAASFVLWLTTKNMTQDTLITSFNNFAEKLANGKMKLKWRKSGLATLKQYQKDGAFIIIVTASPEWLASALFKAIDCNAVVVGSTLKMSKGAWVGDFHCSHKAKCSRLEELGYGTQWASVYTDSPDDIPLLMQTNEPNVVNCKNKSDLKKFQRAVPRYQSIIW